MTPLDSVQTATSPRSRSASGWLLAVVIAALAGIAFAVWTWLRPLSMPVGVSREAYDDARRELAETYGRSPDRGLVLFALGDKAVADGRLETALDCYRLIDRERRAERLPARLQEAQVLLRLNRVREAEQGFLDYLSRAVGNPAARREDLRGAWKWLTYLLSVELRFEERKTHLLDVHSAGLADVFDSKQLYFPHLLIWHSVTGRHPLGRYLDEAPQDSQLQLAMARYEIYEGRIEEARDRLERLHQERTEDLRILGALLECHFEANDWAALSAAASALPDLQDNEPWLLTRMRGELALHEKKWDAAIEAFERLLKADPANPWSQMGLARAYGELGRPADRERALERSLVLSQIRVSLPNVTESDPRGSRDLAEACRKIDYHEAAEAFHRHAERIEQNVPRSASESLK